jgi:hypothetical protein
MKKPSAPILIAIVLYGLRAFGQAAPVPPSYTLTGLDAGSASIQGPLVVGGTESVGGTITQGTNNIGVDGGANLGNVYVGWLPGSSRYSGVWAAGVTQTINNYAVLLDASTGNVYLNAQSGATLQLGANDSTNVLVTASGIQIGSGTVVSNVAAGTCTLDGGSQCSVTLGGVTSSSLCHVTPKSATANGCYYTGGTGFVVVTCNAGSVAAVAVHCDD